jgi:hypothetical protein
VTESHHDVTGPHHDVTAPHDDVTGPPHNDHMTSYDVAPAPPEVTASVGDPRVRDAVRRLDEISDLPPAEHVEVYESVHASLQESLAEASRQADEAPADGNPPS